MANPMALVYANDTTKGETSNISYATVYPLGMFYSCHHRSSACNVLCLGDDVVDYNQLYSLFTGVVKSDMRHFSFRYLSRSS